MRRITKSVPALLVTLVLAAACSGGDTDSGGADASTTGDEASQTEAESADSADSEQPADEDAGDAPPR